MQILHRHALAIDSAQEQSVFHMRRADYDRRERSHREAEEARRRKLWEQDRAERERVDQLASDLIGAEGTRVRVSVSATDTTINSITVRSSYDKEGIHSLKELRGEWNPKDRSWKVTIGWGEWSKAERVLNVVLGMRSRLDR